MTAWAALIRDARTCERTQQLRKGLRDAEDEDVSLQLSYNACKSSVWLTPHAELRSVMPYGFAAHVNVWQIVPLLC